LLPAFDDVVERYVGMSADRALIACGTARSFST
jgi:hypothetical protein